ncbi:YdcF family protein [Pontibacter sp. MBLB2868]|uniref:YdcF family protein n=1 Tax=Pontibacter sp. MBLB2868 TaxID=3451555 RepID=UPI003F756A53
MIEELIIRTLCDTLPSKPADAVFLFGQTEDNQQSVFDATIYLLHNRLADKVMFIQSEAMSGYPGFEVWQQALMKSGIAEEVEPVPIAPDTEQLNTRIEAEAMVHHAREKGYEQVIVTAAPFQQPRAFMAAVTAVQHLYPSLKVYSFPGKALPWTEEVKHSQGKVKGSRAGLVTGEIERIHKYNAKGDLAKIERVLTYLDKRDRID